MFTNNVTSEAQVNKLTANFNAPNVFENGKKLLQFAKDGDVSAVAELLNKGAPITCDWLGTSPLHLAVINNHYETCEFLLKTGVCKDCRTKVDRTPLHFAAFHGHTDILRLLLKNGADVECRDMLHMTPLHWAIEKAHTECVKALLNFDADPLALSRFKKTPLSIAMEMNWHEVVVMLQKLQNRVLTQTIDNSQTKISMPKITDDYEDNLRNLKNNKPITADHINEIESENMDTDKEPHHVLASLLPQVEESPNEATLQFLKEHGITMLPTDNTNTVNSAIQSGRKVVLSDAGKLVLKDVTFQKDASKVDDLKKSPIILPSSQLKNAKIYTINGNPVLAKPNILQKLPFDSIKKTSPINFVQIPKVTTMSSMKFTPINKSIKINKNIKIVNSMPIKTENTGLISATPMSRQISKIIINKMSTNSPKIINLKNFNNSAKIIVKKNNLKNAVLESDKNTMIVSSNESVKSEMASITNISTDLNSSTSSNENEVERLKSELALAKEEIEYYKLQLNELNMKLAVYKDRNCHSLMELDSNSID